MSKSIGPRPWELMAKKPLCGKRRSDGMALDCSTLYTSMVSLRNYVKILHFQTQKYNIHKLTDDFLEEYDSLFDTFWEAIQSNQFRISFKKNIGYSFHDVNEESIHIYLNQVYDLLSESMESFHPAARISAENIIEYIDIFRYLLTFE